MEENMRQVHSSIEEDKLHDDHPNKDNRSWAFNQRFEQKFKSGDAGLYVKPVNFNKDTNNYDGRRLTTQKKPKVIATPLSKDALRRRTVVPG